MFSVICAAGGTAPANPHNGFTTFDFNQAVHPAFALVAAGAPGAPTGCCLALTMEWLHNWRAQHIGYQAWVNAGGGGNAGVLAHTVAAHVPPGPWPATVNGIMAPGLGFVAAGGLVAGPAWGNAAALAAVVLAHRYTILVATGGIGSHAFGVFRAGNAVYFFDSNHGEVFFQTALDFANWFFGNFPITLVWVTGPAPALSRLQFN